MSRCEWSVALGKFPESRDLALFCAVLLDPEKISID